MPGREESLYEPVRKYLQRCFSVKGETHLEVTHTGKASDEFKKRLDDAALYLIQRERILILDIMGYIVTSKSDYGESRDLITVEVKAERPTTADMLQARNYGSAFDARYALLVSSEGLPEEVRRLCEKRYKLTEFYAYDKVVYGKFDVNVGSVAWESWYPRPPFNEWPREPPFG